MKIRYRNTVEDLLAFHEYHSAHSPTIQRQVAWQRWGIAVCIFMGVPIVARFAG
jgi:hypothetical protein